MDGLKLFNLDLHGKSVLLKPNLVEFVPGKEVCTHPALIGAAAECLFELGARKVIVGEGSGHQRDTELLLAQCGLDKRTPGREEFPSSISITTNWSRSRFGPTTRDFLISGCPGP